MAGSAAIALVVLAMISDPGLGMLYLLLFSVGTIAGMIVVTTLMTVPMTMLIARSRISRRWLTLASGLVSLACGVIMVRTLTGSPPIFP